MFMVVNVNLVYELDNWKVEFILLNLFDSCDYDIDYWYVSCLFGEFEDGVEDNYYYFIEFCVVCVGIIYWF